MKKKLLCFVIPYFGCLPNNIRLWLKTCSYNPTYNFLIFTDDTVDYQPPKNVKIIHCSFADIQKRVKTVFDFSVALDHPKKLCDLKPAYGYIFEDELQEYKFWGYCDLDQYFGNLESFISEDYLEQYDKIFSLGHMTIYRNTPEINRIFMETYEKSDKVITSYKEIFSSSRNYIFDEWPVETVNINVLSEQHGIRTCYDWPMFDVLPHRSSFEGSIYDAQNHKWGIVDEKNTVFVWVKGHLFACKLVKGKLVKKEIIYAHIQKRLLKIGNYDAEYDQYIIYPNRIKAIRSIDDSIISRYCYISQVRGRIHIEEFKWKCKNVMELWKYRFNKYIFKRHSM